MFHGNAECGHYLQCTTTRDLPRDHGGTDMMTDVIFPILVGVPASDPTRRAQHRLEPQMHLLRGLQLEHVSQLLARNQSICDSLVESIGYALGNAIGTN